ncbi:MAG TPA: 4-hydroxy-tetrahydrodipicolinate synthase [Jiangellaceae bacterium]
MPDTPSIQIEAPFGRVLTAMATPFHHDGSLDTDGAAALATHLVEHGCDGLVISGTTGESPTTTDAEKERLLRAVVEAVGDRASIVAGVGTYDTHHTVELATAAEKAGADGLLVVTPYYSKPTQEGLLQHFGTAADATGLPVMLYDIPPRSIVPIAPDTMARLAEHERIVAVKDATGNVFQTSETIARTGLAYYCGEDALNLPLLAVGAVGMVSVVAHAAAAEYVEMVRAVDAGDIARARAIHQQLIPAVRAIMTRAPGATMSKAVAELAGVIGSRTMRLPLVPATDDEVAELRAGLAEAGLKVAEAA